MVVLEYIIILITDITQIQFYLFLI